MERVVMAQQPTNAVRGNVSPSRHGFSLVELMVVVAVIAILLGLLMPGLARVRETTYRVMSASNQRSLGQGFTLWAGSHSGKLPPSRLLFDNAPDLSEMMRAYAPLAEDERFSDGGVTAAAIKRKQSGGGRPLQPLLRHGWDGLGHLFASGLIPEPTTFYSPAHWGVHPFERYEHDWAPPSEEESGPPDHVVYSNYHYCGHLDARGRPVRLERDANKIILTDGMRRQSDVTHRDGINILRANGSVEWKPDPTLMPRLQFETAQSPFSIVLQNGIISEIFADPWNRLGYWEGAGGSP